MSSNRRKEFLDLLMVLGTALVVIALGGGALLLADRYHINFVWIFFVCLCLGFFAQVGWNYRREFRSIRFVLFFCCWLLIHLLVFVFCVAFLGWVYWVLAVSVEIFFFYATAYWIFGLKPPTAELKRRHTALHEAESRPLGYI
jgi:hypothetical protein